MRAASRSVSPRCDGARGTRVPAHSTVLGERDLMEGHLWCLRRAGGRLHRVWRWHAPAPDIYVREPARLSARTTITRGACPSDSATGRSGRRVLGDMRTPAPPAA